VRSWLTLWPGKIDVNVPLGCYRFLDEAKMSDVGFGCDMERGRFQGGPHSMDDWAQPACSMTT
jgi:hypothetical protein